MPGIGHRVNKRRNPCLLMLAVYSCICPGQLGNPSMWEALCKLGKGALAHTWVPGSIPFLPPSNSFRSYPSSHVPFSEKELTAALVGESIPGKLRASLG